MIPINITREHVLSALKKIDQVGVPEGRSSRKFFLNYKGKRFPPKYVISIANLYANGILLDPSFFSGGKETNNYLMEIGFEIESIPISVYKRRSAKLKRKKPEVKEARHNERCQECKKNIEVMLRKLYEGVKTNYRFYEGTIPENFEDSSCFLALKEIFTKLQTYRGYKNFVRSQTLPHCDFFVEEPGFILEFDESQHFTIPRSLTLSNYPENIKLGFPKWKWIRLCEEIKSSDNDPPFRDEQRAWYDTLRDFLPVIRGFNPTVRVYSKEMKWCSLDPDDPSDLKKFKNLIEQRKEGIKKSWVATVLIESYRDVSSDERKELLSQIINKLAKDVDGDGVILFPGGYISAGKKKASILYNSLAAFIREELNKVQRNFIVCVGIDGRVNKFARDQIAVAISKRGIEAIGRKFYAAPVEEGYVQLAENYQSKENGKPRTFYLGGRTFFLGACYDSFGIKHNLLPNPGIEVILDLVHGFSPKGEGSGCVYFAKHGFAGASKYWDCPVFGAAVFFNRRIPEDWPSGVYWNQGNKSTQIWRYKDNPMKIDEEYYFIITEGKAVARIYELSSQFST